MGEFGRVWETFGEFEKVLESFGRVWESSRGFGRGVFLRVDLSHLHSSNIADILQTRSVCNFSGNVGIRRLER